MSETLLNWLKNDLNLEHDIKSFESDFANGYLFAEILQMNNIISNLSSYHNDNEPSTIYNNYVLLKRAFNEINIHLNEDTINSLINEHKGLAGSLLYKIKTQFDRKKINFDAIMSTKPIEGPSKSILQTEPNVVITGKKKLKPLSKTTTAFQPNTSRKDKMMNTYLNEIKEEEYNRKRQTAISPTQPNEIETDMKYFQTTTTQETNELDTKYCALDTLENNLVPLGIDLKSIDPKIKKYAVGDKSNFVKTDTVMKRIKIKVQNDNIEKKKTRLKSKVMSETERLLRNSFLKVPQLRMTSNQFTNFSKRNYYEDNRKVAYRISNTQKKRDFFKLSIIRSNHGNNKLISEDEKKNEFNAHLFFYHLNKEKIPDRIKAIEAKEKRRETTVPKIRQMIDIMIDITEEAFDYQQENQCDLINLPGWKEWMSLFIEEKVYHKPIKIVKTYLLSEEEQNMYNASIEIVIPEDIIKYEYLNYLSFIGQWSLKNAIPQNEFGKKLKLYDILGNDISHLLAAGKYIIQGIMESTLKTMSNEAFEPKQDDIDNITIPSSIIKNEYLGDIIEYAMEIKNSESNNPRQSCDYDNNNNNTIIQDFPADNNNIEHDTIKASYEHIPIKICLVGHILSGRKTLGKIISEIYPKIKLYSIETVIQEYLELYERVRSPIENLPKFKLMKKNQIEQMEKDREKEYEKNKAALDIIEPLAKKEIEHLSDESLIDILLMAITKDFPYRNIDEINEENPNRAQRKAQIEEELEKYKEEQLKKTKTKGKDEQNLRAELDKLIYTNYEGFILVDFPKTYDQFVLLEKKATGFIQEIDKELSVEEMRLIELTLAIDKNYHQKSDKSFKSSFFSRFICLEVNQIETLRRYTDRKIDPSTKIIYHPEDNPAPENDKKLKDRLLPITEPSESELISMIESYDLSFDKLQNFFSIFNTCLIIPSNSLTKEEQIDLIKEAMQEIVNEYENPNSKNVVAAINQRSTLGMSIAMEDESEANMTIKYRKRCEEVKKKIPFQLLDNILIEWSDFSDDYTNSIKAMFREIGKQKRKVIIQMDLIQKGFIDFLNIPSNKKDLISIFTSKYNTIISANELLKFHPTILQEIKDDLNELTDYFWEMINTRKQEAINERQLIMNNGFIEKQMAVFYSKFESLFLLEAKKFLFSINIVRKFYSYFDIGRVYDYSCIRIDKLIKDIISGLDAYDLLTLSPHVGKKIISPKIEKIYKNAIKMIFAYDNLIQEIENKIKSSQSLNTSEASAIITHRKKKMGLKRTQSLITKYAFVPDEEVKAAIKAEKAKYKLRITMLKHLGIHYLNELKIMSQNLFKKLDQWIIASVKSQNETMNELIAHFKTELSNSKREVEYDMELDQFDIYHPEHYSFTIFPHKEIGCEAIDHKSFIQIMNECKMKAIQGTYIDEHTLIDIYFKKHALELKSPGIYKYICNFSFYQYFFFMKKLYIDNPSRKIIDLNQFFTLIALSCHTVISNAEEEEMRNEIKAKLINNCNLIEEDFYSIKFWFEKDSKTSEAQEINQSNGKMNDNLFHQLKELLFEINKNYKNEVNYIQFTNTISLRGLNQTDLQNKSFTHYKDLFAS